MIDCEINLYYNKMCHKYSQKKKKILLYLFYTLLIINYSHEKYFKYPFINALL